MKKRKMLLAALTGVLVLCGCNQKKYNVDYNGEKDFYIGAKDSYAAGTKVILKYDFIATDTDYSFYVDGERPDITYKDNAFIITFIMPDHDVKVECNSVNTMYYDPSIEYDTEPVNAEETE